MSTQEQKKTHLLLVINECIPEKKKFFIFSFIYCAYFFFDYAVFYSSHPNFFLLFLVQSFRTLTKDKMTMPHREQKTSGEAVLTKSTSIAFFSSCLTILSLSYIFILKPRPRKESNLLISD